DAAEALEDSVSDRPREALEQQTRRAREHLADELREPAVVDGLVDEVARTRRLLDVDPEIDEEALPEPPLLLEVAVVPEHGESRELDRHATMVPRSTAAATASASTVSRTSCARTIHAPRSYAATAAPSDADIV